MRTWNLPCLIPLRTIWISLRLHLLSPSITCWISAKSYKITWQCKWAQRTSCSQDLESVNLRRLTLRFKSFYTIFPFMYIFLKFANIFVMLRQTEPTRKFHNMGELNYTVSPFSEEVLFILCRQGTVTYLRWNFSIRPNNLISHRFRNNL
jgi:hypothetical protein